LLSKPRGSALGLSHGNAFELLRMMRNPGVAIPVLLMPSRCMRCSRW
jgi:hypothetical protein